MYINEKMESGHSMSFPTACQHRMVSMRTSKRQNVCSVWLKSNGKLTANLFTESSLAVSQSIAVVSFPSLPV